MQKFIIQSILVPGKEGAKRGQREGKERVRLGLPLHALSLPSFKCHFAVNEWCLNPVSAPE